MTSAAPAAVMSVPITKLDHPVLRPQPGVPWGETMVLNPAIIADPDSPRLHMLFRASGPWPQAQLARKPAPYPIFLGYACSDDGGRTWQADWSRPALAPALQTSMEKITIRDRDNHEVVNHANGCIEDPRLFHLEGKVYCTTACRMFPPGPYWERDDPMQCAPDWARRDTTLGRAASENVTVSVLWEVDLAALAARRYQEAFVYVTHLTDPELGDNRDVMLFPETIAQDGRPAYLCLHRPARADKYGAEFGGLRPSIFVATARRLNDLPTALARHHLLAQPELWWERDRIGASWGPLPLGERRWLLPYHGKLDQVIGYTQSFMIVEITESGRARVVHRCPERLMHATHPWELDGLFATPCLFTCGGAVLPSGKLLMSYGAADTVAGVAWTDLESLVAAIENYGADGEPL